MNSEAVRIECENCECVLGNNITLSQHNSNKLNCITLLYFHLLLARDSMAHFAQFFFKISVWNHTLISKMDFHP